MRNCCEVQQCSIVLLTSMCVHFLFNHSLLTEAVSCYLRAVEIYTDMVCGVTATLQFASDSLVLIWCQPINFYAKFCVYTRMCVSLGFSVCLS